MATLLLDPDCAVTETVRIADLIDNTYQVWQRSWWPLNTSYSWITPRRQHMWVRSVFAQTTVLTATGEMSASE